MKKRKDWRMKKETRFDSSKKLGKKRKGIDLIDQKLLLLLNERLHIALEIGKIKEEMGKKIYDFKREQEVLERLKGKNKGPLKRGDLIKIFTTIMKVCRNSQT
jgi:chorismate mutase/prephenate dehydratase